MKYRFTLLLLLLATISFAQETTDLVGKYSRNIDTDGNLEILSLNADMTFQLDVNSDIPQGPWELKNQIIFLNYEKETIEAYKKMLSVDQRLGKPVPSYHSNPTVTKRTKYFTKDK